MPLIPDPDLIPVLTPHHMQVLAGSMFKVYPRYPVITPRQVLAGSMFMGLKMAGMLRINEAVETLGAQLHSQRTPASALARPLTLARTRSPSALSPTLTLTRL